MFRLRGPYTLRTYGGRASTRGRWGEQRCTHNKPFKTKKETHSLEELFHRPELAQRRLQAYVALLLPRALGAEHPGVFPETVRSPGLQ